jgi:hypothetical protein
MSFSFDIIARVIVACMFHDVRCKLFALLVAKVANELFQCKPLFSFMPGGDSTTNTTEKRTWSCCAG